MKRKLWVVLLGVVIVLTVGIVSCSMSDRASVEDNEKVVTQEEKKDSKDEEKEVANDELENELEDVEEIGEEVEDTEEDSESNKSEKTGTSKKEDTTNKKETNSSSASKKEEEKHTHEWEPIYVEVDNGHYEDVCVKEAWTEEVTKTKKVAAEICKGCGHVMFTQEDIVAHTKPAMLAGRYECGTYKTGYVDVEVTETVEHPAEYEKIWVPKIEKVVSGYQCECGATK